MRTWKLIDAQLMPGFARAALVAPTKDIRHYLNAVWICRHDQSGRDFVAATNGHSMLIEWLAAGTIDWGPLPDAGRRIGIDIDTMKKILKAAKTRNGIGDITITATVHGEDPAKWALPGSRTLNLSCRGTAFECMDAEGTPPDFLRVDPLQAYGDHVEWPALCNINPMYLEQVADVAYALTGRTAKSNPFPVPLVMWLRTTAIARGNGAKDLARTLRTTATVACPDKAAYRARAGGAWTMVVMPIFKLYEGEHGPDAQGMLEALGTPVLQEV